MKASKIKLMTLKNLPRHIELFQKHLQMAVRFH